MTNREIMMQNNENLSWCKPLSFENGNVVVAFNEGTIAGIQIDGNDIEITPDAIKSVANRINYMGDDIGDDYIRFIKNRIFFDPDHEELPCRLCPWFDACCVMDEECEEFEECEEYPDCQC